MPLWVCKNSISVYPTKNWILQVKNLAHNKTCLDRQASLRQIKMFFFKWSGLSMSYISFNQMHISLQNWNAVKSFLQLKNFFFKLKCPSSFWISFLKFWKYFVNDFLKSFCQWFWDCIKGLKLWRSPLLPRCAAV